MQTYVTQYAAIPCTLHMDHLHHIACSYIWSLAHLPDVYTYIAPSLSHLQGFASNAGASPDPDMLKTLMEEIVRLKAKLGNDP